MFRDFLAYLYASVNDGFDGLEETPYLRMQRQEMIIELKAPDKCTGTVASSSQTRDDLWAELSN